MRITPRKIVKTALTSFFLIVCVSLLYLIERLPSNSFNTLHRQEGSISISKINNGVPLLPLDEYRESFVVNRDNILDTDDNDIKKSKLDIDKDGTKLELKPIGSQTEFNSIAEPALKFLPPALESAEQYPKAQIFADEDSEQLVANSDKDVQKLKPEKIGSQTELNSIAKSVPKLVSPVLESTDTDQKARKFAALPPEEEYSLQDSAPSKEDLSRFYKSHEEMDSMLNLTNIKHLDWKSLPLSNIDFIYSYNKEELERSMIERNEQIQAVCSKLPKGFSRPFLFHFKELKISWCPTYKAGSTTWKDYFVHRFVDKNAVNPDLARIWNRKLSGKNNIKGKKVYSKEQLGSLRFTFVRHPIVRILSYWKMQRTCNEWVRSGQKGDLLIARKVLSNEDEGTFKKELDLYHEHCTKVAKGQKEEQDIPSFSSDNPYLNPPYKTFPELVDRIQRQRKKLQSKDWEGHWAPASEWCELCTNQMDMVGLLENEPWDLWYIVDRLGLWLDRKKFLVIHNTFSKHGKPSDESELDEVVSKLSESQKRFLNGFYDADFKMFGYAKLSLDPL